MNYVDSLRRDTDDVRVNKESVATALAAARVLHYSRAGTHAAPTATWKVFEERGEWYVACGIYMRPRTEAARDVAALEWSLRARIPFTSGRDIKELVAAQRRVAQAIMLNALVDAAGRVKIVDDGRVMLLGQIIPPPVPSFDWTPLSGADIDGLIRERLARGES